MAADRGQDSASGTYAPVLTEMSAYDRVLMELKRAFQSVRTNEQGHACKVELKAWLESGGLPAGLVQEAGLNGLLALLRSLAGHDGDFVSWEQLQHYAERPLAVVPTAVGENIAGEKLVKRLKMLFDSLGADEEGAVSKEELTASLRQDTGDVHGADGESIGKLVGQANFTPLWNALEVVDTQRDGHITWNEFKAHIRGAARQAGDVQGEAVVVAIVEEAEVRQSCWGCC